ncbi:MAG: DUF3124 domain-containing protein [Deltaproteobacteria bacterium]|nr:DUF3124 domain-containing protein [Deltaproteobacteria bacterium]
MSDRQEHPEWLLWLMEHGVRILILLAIAFMAFVYTQSRRNTEARLGAIEAQVKNELPRAFEPPNLANFEAKGVDRDALRVHEAAYLPVYSHIYYDGGRPYMLEITLSIRNIDPNEPVYLSKADYYDTDGKLSKSKIDRLIVLKPLQTIEFLIERHDASGGSGANFIVEWHAADKSVHAPLIEAVMVGRSGTNAISFVRKSEPLPQWAVD